MPVLLKTIPRVLVALPVAQKACRDKLHGILKYAQLNGPWDVQLLEDRLFIAQLKSFRNWHADGIIAHELNATLTGLLRRTRKVPVVFLDPPSPCPANYSSVSHDSRQIGETVADCCMRIGLGHFAYAGSVPATDWSQVRGNAYANRLRREGFSCAFYRPKSTDDWGKEQKHMAAWLTALPKPCGLFAAFDQQAKQILDICLMAGIRVPEDMVVVGVDNDEPLCEMTTPTLSSVQPDLERGGYIAAELLDRLMRGRQRHTVHHIYGVQRIIHRQSSLYIQASSPLAASAVEFIRVNACADIAVPDIAKALHVSRSILEKEFRRVVKHTVLEEIQTRRLERLCLLLRETSLSIGEIGERCGYSTETYLKRLFRKRFGMTMRAYRKNLAKTEFPALPPPTDKRDI